MKRVKKNVEPIDLNDVILTPIEAGALFGVSGWAMYKRAKNGQATGHYMGRKLYFLRSELLAAVKQR